MNSIYKSVVIQLNFDCSSPIIFETIERCNEMNRLHNNHKLISMIQRMALNDMPEGKI